MTESCTRCARSIEYLGEAPSFCMYCGHPLSDSTLLKDLSIDYQQHVDDTFAEPSNHVGPGMIPVSVGGFRLLRKLGEGGMGSVHEGEDPVTGRRVAVKLISPHLLGSQVSVERFLQEGRLASAISHPRCVFVLGADEEQGRPYIIMELMPGSTLKDLVTNVGPLPVEQAVAKILDVIDGLREAHRMGVLHRDVKPSNCFVEADGRVKIGDFGLSKSLSGDMNLTRTGSFLGTPLYAAPEQIRGEDLDGRADVYSATATLYFLLCGRAPFEGGNAESTLAKIVSEPAPSVRVLIPEIPRALDAVLLKGLERNRDRRWRDLDELSEALLPFVPSRLSISGVGIRLLAFMGDIIITRFFALALFHGITYYSTGKTAPPLESLLVTTVFDLMIWIGYFVVAEGLTGSSPFKYFMRMKVYCAGRASIPGVKRSLARTAILYAIIDLPVTIFSIYTLWTAGRPMFLATVVARVVGIAFICSTMRASNDYRGLHEILSGTRVVRLPSKRSLTSNGLGRWPRREWALSRPSEMPMTLGSYTVEGAIRWDDQICILQAIDPGLHRRAWILLGRVEEEILSPERRETDRLTRPRWLAAGQWQDWRWDAFVAPVGRPLVDLVNPKNPLNWAESRRVLEALTEELIESIATNSLPSSLSTSQVFVQPDSQIQLLDADPTNSSERVTSVGDPQSRALSLVHSVAILSLTGRQLNPVENPRILGSIPIHARRILDRLRPGVRSYANIEAIRMDLDSTRNLPCQLTITTRYIRAGIFLAKLIISIGAASVPVGLAITAKAMTSFDNGPEDKYLYDMIENSVTRYVSVLPLVIPLIWMAWAMATRGGLTRPLLGLTLARPDGSPVSGLRCFVREGILWGFVAIVLRLSLWNYISKSPLSIAPEWCFCLLILYAIWGILSGRRMPHEWISGTIVVPK